MKDPFLEHCGGWTPAPDILTRNYGFETAYTWGRIRRLCQLGGGTFTASHEAIGDRIGMSRRALIEILKRLISDGYVEDLTPGVRNRAHTYSVKKGEAKILSGMQISHTESDIPLKDNEGIEPEGIDVGMRNLHSEDAEIAHLAPSGMQDLPNGYAKNAHPGMQNLHLNRDSLETPKETTTKESLTPVQIVPTPKESRPPKALKTKEYSPQQKQLFLALAGMCHIDLSVATPKQRGQLDHASKALSKAITDLDQFKARFPVYWLAMDWRGQKGQSPDPPQIQEAYGDYCHWLKNGALASGQTLQQPKNGAIRASPALSAERQEIARQLQAEDAKEIYNPLDRS
jgi:DNA-binding Lrp family transcriptional regulator